MRARTHWIAGLVALLFGAALPGLAGVVVTGDADAPIICQGDRVVFYGDSITEQRLYTRYVQQYLYARYPEANLTFFNAGWSGDTARGGRSRLTRDVLRLKPSLVTLFFGMNDGTYTTVSDGILGSYGGGLEGVVRDLHAAGVRAAVFTPGCVDYTRSDALATCDYNKTLAALADVALAVAAQEKCVVAADLHRPMLSFQSKRQAAEPSFTMIPDSVHPDVKGHLFMARVMLSALGAEPLPGLGSADLISRQYRGLKLLTCDPQKVEFETTTPAPVPFWFNADSCAAVFRESGMAELAAQMLEVKGLAQGEWRLSIDGVQIGQFDAGEYARGLRIDGSYSLRGRVLHDLIESKENHYFDVWRNQWVAGAETPERETILATMLRSDEEYQRAVRQAAQPAAVRILLLKVPTTRNLALGTPATGNDEREDKRWSLAGLTDGNWENGSESCYCSSLSTSFPKWVQVDLGAAKPLCAVDIGVPPFGATRTIRVGVSTTGRTFREVGRVECPPKQQARHLVVFKPVTGRYVRLLYPDRHDPAPDTHHPTQIFTSELEVFGPP